MLMYRWQPFAVSLEWTFAVDGVQHVVVPDGLSACRRRRYFKGGYDTYEIMVPSHTGVLFHIGNREVESKACVLVGKDFKDFNPAPGLQDSGIGDSRVGFAEFMDLADGHEEFPLFVTTVESDRK